MTNDFFMLIYLAWIPIMVLICLVVAFLWRFVNKSSKQTNKHTEEFNTAISALNGIIEAHVQTIFDEKVNQLRSQFDLKTESQTNSKKQFVHEFDGLCNQTTKTIIKTYLSESLLKTLLEYYKIEGLTLFILSILRKR